jgi:hypothetical protein
LRRAVEQVGRFELHYLPDGSRVYYEPVKHAYYGEVKESKTAEGGYSFVRDSRLTGVSTPVKALDTNTDPLCWWAAKLDQYGIAQLVEESDPSNLEWLRDPAEINRALKEAKLTWFHVRDQAATRGSNVHERIFLALSQDDRPPSLASLAEDERGYGQAALKWWRDRKPTPLYAEQVTLCAEHRVAGRFDLLCEVDGERILIDAKTREKGQVRRSDHAQLAGYELCNASCGIGASDRQLALILTPWGEYREFDCLSDADDFLAALEAYRRGGDLEKRMREAEKVAA